MMVGTPTQTSPVHGTWPTRGALLWLSRSRWSHGEAMPDKAALIEAHIPGLRRFACGQAIRRGIK